MKNIDKLKEMSAEELIIFINGNKCDRCIYNNTNCMHDLCHEGTKAWLGEEVEPTIDYCIKEYENFCTGKCCEMCSYSSKHCEHDFIIDNFNINNGKITRREK